MQSDKAKILVVDDDITNISLLKAIFQRLGYQVFAANNGEEAIAQYQSLSPDVILMDIMMPVVNGYEATVRIRELESDTFTPIIFVTALTDDDSLAKCIECGGNDFLTKPYNTILIDAKIKSFLQLRSLYHSEREKIAHIEKHNVWLENEYRISEGVINKITKKEHLHEESIKFKISPKALFNGDILMVTKTPEKITRVMIGDFTGHGMSGAIGSIPVAGIFYSMTEKGFSIEAIVREINSRLSSVLPVGIFLAAALIDYDPRSKHLRVWNGGSPDIMIYSDEKHKIRRTIESKNYPFAVVSSDEFKIEMEDVFLRKGDRIIAFTDGALSVFDEFSNKIRNTGVYSVISKTDDGEKLFDNILDCLTNYPKRHDLIDDVTLIEITTSGVSEEISFTESSVEAFDADDSQVQWSMSYELRPGILRKMDPIPMIMQSLGEMEYISEHKQPLYLILRELFSNALDHGLLNLDSRIKQQTNGFEKFYDEKERRLESLDSGKIEIRLNCSIDGRNGAVLVNVKDSGNGFDFVELEKSSAESSYHGRGVTILNQICAELRYIGNGNEVLATYKW
ncbi:MAG: fused response regulator/phosphatase [Gammaproteobacteria bacterium]|nr:fused response regulator/phosphatase [Gammaproteobacteria bacterium]